MTLTIELPPNLETRSVDKARAAGMDIRAYSEKLVETAAQRPSLRERH